MSKGEALELCNDLFSLLESLVTKEDEILKMESTDSTIDTCKSSSKSSSRNSSKSSSKSLSKSSSKSSSGEAKQGGVAQSEEIEISETSNDIFSEESENILFYDPDNDAKRSFYFQNPEETLISDVPGSPWAQHVVRRSTRPTEPLPLAIYASLISLLVAIGWVAYLTVVAVWSYTVGRAIVEIILAVISFFGLFWNSYFIVSSLIKCFIPSKAFKTNTKSCSLMPEIKDPHDEWMSVTIQVPIYKESLQDVLMPTLKSCVAARNHYIASTGGDDSKCNVVVCDDGIMALLHDNFPAAEMLWNSIADSHGEIVNLGKLLKRVPEAARRHLKGLRSKNVHEAFHRMLFYYHYNIGWVARGTIDPRGKFKKASNLNSHLRLVFGAKQLIEPTQKNSFDEALLQLSHDQRSSRHIMHGNNVRIGSLIVVNDADARMIPHVILKTVPEFLNDATLGFTQHTTKTLDNQRGESYFLNMLSVYTDALYTRVISSCPALYAVIHRLSVIQSFFAQMPSSSVVICVHCERRSVGSERWICLFCPSTKLD